MYSNIVLCGKFVQTIEMIQFVFVWVRGIVWYLSSQAIAFECGIYDPDYGLAMEGPEFRKLTPKQLDDVLPRLQVRTVTVSKTCN